MSSRKQYRLDLDRIEVSEHDILYGGVISVAATL